MQIYFYIRSEIAFVAARAQDEKQAEDLSSSRVQGVTSNALIMWTKTFAATGLNSATMLRS
jgi:hypothetical protein